MKTFLLIILLTISFQAMADTRIVLNGKSWHIGGNTYYIDNSLGITESYNEFNTGIGVEKDISDWKMFNRYLTIGTLNDSYKLPMHYVGIVHAYRMHLNDTFFADIGVLSAIVSKDEFWDGKPVPVILPTVSVGTNRLAVNFTYIPMLGNTYEKNDGVGTCIMVCANGKATYKRPQPVQGVLFMQVKFTF